MSHGRNGNLIPTEKRVLVYRDLPPMTYEELAAHFNLPVTCVRARIRRNASLEEPLQRHYGVHKKAGARLYDRRWRTLAQIEKIRESKRIKARIRRGSAIDAPTRRPTGVTIAGVYYTSLRKAAISCGVSAPKIKREIQRNGGYPVLQLADLKPRPAKPTKPKDKSAALRVRCAKGTKRPLAIAGVWYGSVLEASRALGISPTKIQRVYLQGKKRTHINLGKTLRRKSTWNRRS